MRDIDEEEFDYICKQFRREHPELIAAIAHFMFIFVSNKHSFI